MGAFGFFLGHSISSRLFTPVFEGFPSPYKLYETTMSTLQTNVVSKKATKKHKIRQNRPKTYVRQLKAVPRSLSTFALEAKLYRKRHKEPTPIMGAFGCFFQGTAFHSVF